MKNIILALNIFLVACNKGNISPEKFIAEAKKQDISSLMSLNIEARNERDNVFHYSYFHVFTKNDTLIIPSIEFFDDIKRDSILYKSVLKFTEDRFLNSDEKVELAKKYAQRIDSIYKSLGVVNSKSNPNLGKFIEFTLDEKCKVYYLEDSSTLTSYWKDKFSKLQKVDNKWYYECK